jgi:hypothetical protein
MFIHIIIFEVLGIDVVQASEVHNQYNLQDNHLEVFHAPVYIDVM